MTKDKTIEIIKSLSEARERINNFFKSSKRKTEINFPDGLFIEIKKHIRQGEPVLEIHTSGYDGTLPAAEAVEWITWELYDYKAQKFLY